MKKEVDEDKLAHRLHGALEEVLACPNLRKPKKETEDHESTLSYVCVVCRVDQNIFS